MAPTYNFRTAFLEELGYQTLRGVKVLSETADTSIVFQCATDAHPNINSTICYESDHKLRPLADVMRIFVHEEYEEPEATVHPIECRHWYMIPATSVYDELDMLTELLEDTDFDPVENCICPTTMKLFREIALALVEHALDETNQDRPEGEYGEDYATALTWAHRWIAEHVAFANAPPPHKPCPCCKEEYGCFAFIRTADGSLYRAPTRTARVKEVKERQRVPHIVAKAPAAVARSGISVSQAATLALGGVALGITATTHAGAIGSAVSTALASPTAQMVLQHGYTLLQQASQAARHL